jgi:hypothetical protein
MIRLCFQFASNMRFHQAFCLYYLNIVLTLVGSMCKLQQISKDLHDTAGRFRTEGMFHSVIVTL